MKSVYSPKMLELSDVRQKVRSQFVMFAFLSTSKRSQQKTQTVTWTFDCFSLQIAFSLSCKVTVILKAPPSHYRGWSEGK